MFFVASELARAGLRSDPKILRLLRSRAERCGDPTSSLATNDQQAINICRMY